MTMIKGIRFFGGEKNKPEKLHIIRDKADILVFHYNPTAGDARMAAVRSMNPELIIYGHQHRTGHYEHVVKDPCNLLKINVSTWVGKDESAYGAYLIDYNKGGNITADWITIGK